MKCFIDKRMFIYTMLDGSKYIFMAKSCSGKMPIAISKNLVHCNHR